MKPNQRIADVNHHPPIEEGYSDGGKGYSAQHDYAVDVHTLPNSHHDPGRPQGMVNPPHPLYHTSPTPTADSLNRDNYFPPPPTNHAARARRETDTVTDAGPATRGKIGGLMESSVDGIGGGGSGRRLRGLEAVQEAIRDTIRANGKWIRLGVFGGLLLGWHVFLGRLFTPSAFLKDPCPLQR